MELLALVAAESLAEMSLLIVSKTSSISESASLLSAAVELVAASAVAAAIATTVSSLWYACIRPELTRRLAVEDALGPREEDLVLWTPFLPVISPYRTRDVVAPVMERVCGAIVVFAKRTSWK